jgi:hypothetical protein
MPGRRVDDHGRAFKGSQRQVQTWVNDFPDELNARILAELAPLQALAPTITWTSPLREENYKEYRDAEFLKRVNLGDLTGELEEFWPAGGAVWDGLAVYATNTSRGGGVILVEAKSYPGEFYGDGCDAGRAPSEQSRRNRIQIASSLRETQTWLGMGEIPNWMGPLYQSANRLAHVYWLQMKAQRDAWLVHLLFENDPSHPTTRAEWKQAISALDEQLGLAEAPAWHANLILEARQ